MTRWAELKLLAKIKWHDLKTIGRDYMRFTFVAGFVVGNVWGWSWVWSKVFWSWM